MSRVHISKIYSSKLQAWPICYTLDIGNNVTRDELLR